MVSVILATKNRPHQCVRSLESIRANNFSSYEVIVVDQNRKPSLAILDYCNKYPRFRYYHVPGSGKSRALNWLTQQTRGDILAFTDDDCIVHPGWLAAIADFFLNHPGVSGVFGKTLPHEPHQHPGMLCPSTFTHKRRRVFTKPIYHAQHIGFGNNMAFRKNALTPMGGFRTWLGPGSIGQAADDADVALRLLIQGHTLVYSPNIVVSHNKWLTPKESRMQALVYAKGEGACYGYFFFQGHRFAQSLIKSGTRREIKLLAKYANIFFRRGPSRKTIGALYWTLLTLTHRMQGLSIGLYFSLINPLH